MTKRSKIILTSLVVGSTIFFGILIVLGYLDATPLVGLLGVIVGALISEGAKSVSAERNRTHQLRLAAIEKRLQTHQEAYSRWRMLIRRINLEENVIETVAKNQLWWEASCLYLEPAAREAFLHALLSASAHQVEKGKGKTDRLENLYENIRIAGDLIVKGVELPTIKQGEDTTIE